MITVRWQQMRAIAACACLSTKARRGAGQGGVGRGGEGSGGRWEGGGVVRKRKGGEAGWSSKFDSIATLDCNQRQR